VVVITAAVEEDRTAEPAPEPLPEKAAPP